MRNELRPRKIQRKNFIADEMEPDRDGFGAVLEMLLNGGFHTVAEIFPSVRHHGKIFAFAFRRVATDILAGYIEDDFAHDRQVHSSPLERVYGTSQSRK